MQKIVQDLRKENWREMLKVKLSLRQDQALPALNGAEMSVYQARGASDL